MSFQKEKQQQMSKFSFGNPQISLTKSIEFMKRMTVATISQITFLRQVFPKSSFEVRRWEGNNIPILRNSGSDSRKMIDWLKNALEMLAQRQIKKLYFAIEKDNGEDTIETYTFHYTYDRGEIKCYVQSVETDHEMETEKANEELPQEIKTQVLNLLTNNKSHINRLPPLPDSYDLKIYLEFNDNVPEDFVLPKVFRPLDSIDLQFPVDVHTLKVGHIDSKFTTIALKTKSALLSSNNMVNSSEDLFSEPVKEENEFVNAARQSSSIYDVGCQKENSEASSHTEIVSVHVSDITVRCICELGDDIDTIKCTSCSTYQHKPCYKLLVDQTLDKHICVICHSPSSNKICSNVKLLEEQGKNEALYRRALSLCESKKKVSVNTFVSHLNIPRKEAMVIFRRLKEDGCFVHESKERSIRNVNMEHLKEYVYSLHFNKASSNNLFSKDSEEHIPCSSKSGSEKRKTDMESISQKHFKFAG